MKKLSGLFKLITAITYAVPGISFFKGNIYPINISKGLLMAIAEILGGIVILLVYLNRETITGFQTKLKSARLQLQGFQPSLHFYSSEISFSKK
jgi:uncharacterized membrane protein (DUF485 family)